MIYNLFSSPKVVHGKECLQHNHIRLVVHLTKWCRQSFYLTVYLLSPLRECACQQMLLVLHKIKSIAATDVNTFFLRAGKIRSVTGENISESYPFFVFLRPEKCAPSASVRRNSNLLGSLPSMYWSRPQAWSKIMPRSFLKSRSLVMRTRKRFFGLL